MVEPILGILGRLALRQSGQNRLGVPGQLIRLAQCHHTLADDVIIRFAN